MFCVRYWSHNETDTIEEERPDVVTIPGSVIRMEWNVGYIRTIPVSRLIDVIQSPREET